MLLASNLITSRAAIEKASSIEATSAQWPISIIITKILKENVGVKYINIIVSFTSISVYFWEFSTIDSVMAMMINRILLF